MINSYHFICIEKLITKNKISEFYRYYQFALAHFPVNQDLSVPTKNTTKSQASMKNFRKPQSSYFKKRDSFQSPQCSTVVEVNPSCQSQESILQKIIFPDQMNRENNRFRKEPLSEKYMNSLNANRQIGKLNKNYKFYEKSAGPKLSAESEYTELYEYRFKQNQQNVSNYQQPHKASKQKYEVQQNHNYHRQRANSLSATVSLGNLMSRTSKLGPGLQSYQSSEIKKNYSTQKYANHYGYNDENNSQSVIDEVKLHEIQQKIMRYRQKNRKNAKENKQPLRQLPKTTSFRDTMEAQLNNIQIDFAPSQQNRIKKKQTIIDNVSLLDNYQLDNKISLAKGVDNFSRMPGRLISQKKDKYAKENQFVQSKRSEFGLTESENQTNTFRKYSETNNMIDPPLNENLRIEKRSERTKKITKNVYMQPTQKTENDEFYQPKYRERYETQIDMNEKALQLMLEEERQKKYVPLNLQRENKRQFNGDDDELERLNNLEKKFNEHFSSRK